ncbi:hypothetical protein MPSEU_000525100 [Mayamaea pseudoterrestris]|nr:hypothetical protein MPSEU_000525100 [Mayamaea pseudoterrestris]
MERLIPAEGVLPSRYKMDCYPQQPPPPPEQMYPQPQPQQQQQHGLDEASGADAVNIEPTNIFTTDPHATMQQQGDNTVLNAAAALLSIPSHLAAASSSHPYESSWKNESKFDPYSQYPYSHHASYNGNTHATTALLDLVSPVGMLPLAHAATNSHTNATTSLFTMQQQPQQDAIASMSSANNDDNRNDKQQPAYYYEGTCSLSLPEDDDFLSPLHSFIRRYCVEAFTATPKDASESQFGRSHGSRVVPGQVGIRCCFCAPKQDHGHVGRGANLGHESGLHHVAEFDVHHPSSPRRERAVCFPSSLKNIYHSIETWQRRHSLVCEDIPNWVRLSMAELCKTSKSGAGGRRQYWEESARRIGLANTNHGIRFVRPPGQNIEHRAVPLLVVEDHEAARNVSAPFGNENGQPASPLLVASALVDLEPVAMQLPGQPVVHDEDKSLVKDYLYVLLDQMEQCYFSEEDRAGGRSKVKDSPIGYPGMQCRHCKGKAGFGRYFPGSLAALTSANSDRNIYNHIMKCRRCPQPIKDELAMLQQQHQTLKNRRGSRKLFFEKIWSRLHGIDADGEHFHQGNHESVRDDAHDAAAGACHNMVRVVGIEEEGIEI